MALTPAERCSLAAKIAFLRTFSAPFPKPNGTALAIAEDISKAFDAAVAAARRREDLTHADVSKFRAELATTAEEKKEGVTATNLRQCIEDLEALLRRAECPECATGKDGGASPHHHCASGFGDLFALVERYVSTVYVGRGAARSAQDIPVLIFKTFRAKMIQDLITRFGLVASTKIDVEPSASTVSLSIDPSSFKFSSIFQLAYVVFHELTCHAYQGIRSDSVRTNVDNNCPWTEGWMDALAFVLAKDWVEGGHDNWLPLPTTDAVQFMHDYHLARYEPSASLFDENSMGLKAAREAFWNLKRLFQGASASQEQSTSDLRDFSVRLNAHDMTDVEREKLGILLTHALNRKGDPPGLSVAVGACKAFINHDNLDILRGELSRSLHPE